MIRDDLRDIYGTCDRDRPQRNDCYWGKNAIGGFDGCLKTGWRGRRCPHWHPADDTTIDLIFQHHQERI